MRLQSVIFDGSSRDYERMAAVLELSAAQNSPTTPLTILRQGRNCFSIDNAGKGRQQRYSDNTYKTQSNYLGVKAAHDGEVIGFIDCDTMILGDLSEVERMDFDLAYTIRPTGYPFKLNTGLFFVRVSGSMRLWMKRWLEVNFDMLENESFHKQWKKTYGGINQAALGYLLEHQGQEEIPRIKTLELDCTIWNSVSTTWNRISPQTKVVHIMTQLRDLCLGRRPYSIPGTKQVVRLWREFDKQARSEAVTA